MEIVEHLLLVYAGAMLINVVLALMLWWRHRDPHYRALVWIWAASVVTFVLQGALTQSPLVISLAFASVFFVNTNLAELLSSTVGVHYRSRPFFVVLGVAVVACTAASLAGAPFWMVALPITMADALPLFVTAVRIVRQRRSVRLSIARRSLVIVAVLFGLHNLDFAFLRDREWLAPLGFTIALLFAFALSVTTLAVAHKAATEQKTRATVELDAARSIQTRLLPRGEALVGIEMASYVRPAESVGGDYLDTYAFGSDAWFFVGDVTGHGLGAGLVMLMAQSTVSSILHAVPGIAPREVNCLLNRVLSRNLERLGESRHMTVVSLQRTGGRGRFLVSGSHDDVYLWRARTGTVEIVSIAHFPVGVGFLPDLEVDAFRQDEIRLEPGDVLYVGTDGVTEAARGGDPRAGLFGEAPVLEALQEHAASPLTELKTHLVEALDAFTGGVYDDDVTFVLLRVNDEEGA